MAIGLGEQLEPELHKQIFWNPEKPWKKQDSRWRKYSKKMKNRKERKRAKLNPECQPWYGRYRGWEF